MHRQGVAFALVLAVLAAGCLGSAAHSTGGPVEASGPAPAIPAIASGIRGTLRLIGGLLLPQTPPGTYAFELTGGQRLVPRTVVVAASGTTDLSLNLDAK
jgi:hypothetical protein